MKAVIQRVNNASVKVDNKTVGKIDKGLVVLLGISKDWTEEKFEWLAKKIINLRLWGSDVKGFDLSLNDIKGDILLVSQFTLHGVVKGNKPNFRNSLDYETAEKIYEKFIIKLKESGLKIETGVFGAKMKVNLENDGPVTMIIEK